MALLFLDSFDHYLTADLLQKYASLAGGPAIVGGAGRAHAIPPAPDSVPNTFTFVDQTEVALATEITSNPILVTGINVPSPITISGGGGAYSINGGAHLTTPSTVVNGNVVRVYLTSSASPSTAVATTLDIGGVSDTFTVTTGTGAGQSMLQPSDLVYEGALRLEVDLGPGGTGNLSLTGGPPCFRKRLDGKISVFFLGQDYEGWETRHPLVEFEIDPLVPADPVMGTAPTMAYVRTWGEIRHGHILVASGGETNYYSGGNCLQRVDDNTSYLWWMTNDGYTAGADWPELSCTVLHHDTVTFESYGPWRIDKHSTGHRRFCTGQIIELPPAFVAAHCPGFSKGVMGQMGSAVLNSPFGPSLMVFEDFDPTTRPPATACNQPPNVASKTIVAYDDTHKKSRDTRYKTCGWTVAYDCSLGETIAPGLPEWGGADASTAEVDNCSWQTWIDLPSRRGWLVGGLIARTPTGYSAPGDPDGLVHQWYGDYSHGSSSGSGYQDKACCHGQPCPWWGSTGPGAHFRQPMGWIYDPTHFPSVVDLGGAANPWELVPTTDAFEFKAICSGCDIHPPVSVTDQAGVFDWWGSAWLDPITHKLYVGSVYDFTTGYLLPCLYVFQLPGALARRTRGRPAPLLAAQAALRLGAGDTLTTQPLGSSSTTALVGAALKFADIAGTAPFLTILSGATDQVRLRLSGGVVQAARGDGTVLGTGTNAPLIAGRYYHVELETTIHDTAGTVRVRIDGALVLTLASVDTANGLTTWTALRLSGNGGGRIDVDDLYIADAAGGAPWNALLGDCRVDAMVAIGSGAQTEWTPSAGANVTDIDDEVPNGDTDYTAAGTAGLTDSFAMGDVAVPGAPLRGVQVLVSARASTAGSCAVAPVIRHAGVVQVGVGVALTTTYGYVRQVYQVNPGTGAPWVEADFNAAEFGYTRSA